MKPDERIQAKYKIKGRIQTLPAGNMTYQVLEQSMAYLLHWVLFAGQKRKSSETRMRLPR